MTTQTRSEVTITLKLPASVLGKNDRPAHWSTFYRAFQQHKTQAAYEVRNLLRGEHEPWTGPITLHIAWYRFNGKALDVDNIVSRCSPFPDGAQAAGLFVNDAQIKQTIVTQAIDRANPRVELKFTHEEAV